MSNEGPGPKKVFAKAVAESLGYTGTKESLRDAMNLARSDVINKLGHSEPNPRLAMMFERVGAGSPLKIEHPKAFYASRLALHLGLNVQKSQVDSAVKTGAAAVTDEAYLPRLLVRPRMIVTSR